MPSDQDQKQTDFMALYGPVHEPFARFCHARFADEQEAKDLISETVLKAYEHFDQLRHPEAFLGYLFRIAQRIMQQKQKRSRFWGLFSEKKVCSLPDPHRSPEMSTDVRLLYEALEKLPPAQREALLLFEFSGFSLKEIQQIQGVGLSAVKSRLVRGRERLAELLHARQEPKTAAPEANSDTTSASALPAVAALHRLLP